MMSDNYSSEDIDTIECVLNDLNEYTLKIRRLIKVHPDLVYYSVSSLLQASELLLNFLLDDKTLKREFVYGTSRNYSKKELGEIETILNEIDASILFTRKLIKRSSKVIPTAIGQTLHRCKLMTKYTSVEE